MNDQALPGLPWVALKRTSSFDPHHPIMAVGNGAGLGKRRPAGDDDCIALSWLRRSNPAAARAHPQQGPRSAALI
jgi:hypothetical protein